MAKLNVIDLDSSTEPQRNREGLVLSRENQDALQALFGDDVTGCFGKRVQLEPRPMRVAGREPTRHGVTGVIRLKAAPSGNGIAPKAASGENGRSCGKTRPPPSEDSQSGENAQGE